MDKTQATEQHDYTASSLAKAAGVHFTHVARLCREGKLDCQKFGSYWLIRYADGAAWLAARNAKQDAEEL